MLNTTKTESPYIIRKRKNHDDDVQEHSKIDLKQKRKRQARKAKERY